jgi:hypothetical protein
MVQEQDHARRRTPPSGAGTNRSPQNSNEGIAVRFQGLKGSVAGHPTPPVICYFGGSTVRPCPDSAAGAPSSGLGLEAMRPATARLRDHRRTVTAKSHVGIAAALASPLHNSNATLDLMNPDRDFVNFDCLITNS